MYCRTWNLHGRLVIEYILTMLDIHISGSEGTGCETNVYQCRLTNDECVVQHSDFSKFLMATLHSSSPIIAHLVRNYLLPHIGMSLLSAFITMEAMVMVTGIASKYEECGAKVIIGASVGNARRPFILIQWKPPANHIALIITFSKKSNALQDTKYKCVKGYNWKCNSWGEKNITQII